MLLQPFGGSGGQGKGGLSGHCLVSSRGHCGAGSLTTTVLVMVRTTIRSGWAQLTSVDTRDIAISHFTTVEDDTRTGGDHYAAGT
jgi:hypothetical protein